MRRRGRFVGAGELKKNTGDSEEPPVLILQALIAQ